MGEEVQPSLHPWKYICILAANGRLNEGAPKEDCYGNRTKTLFQPQSMYTMALVLPLAWVHGSQLCLNGKWIFASIEGGLQTSCSFLFPTLFLKKSRPSPSYSPHQASPSTKGLQHTPPVSPLHTSQQEGAGCHSGWSFPVLHRI